MTAEQEDPTSKPVHDEQADDAEAARADAGSPPAPDTESTDSDSAHEEQAAGILPPVPDSIEQTTFQPPYGQEQQFGRFSPPQQPGFAPPGPYGPPGSPYPPNQGFPPGGGFPMPEQGGPFVPPGEQNQFAPPGEGQFPPPGEHGQFQPPGEQGHFPPPGDHGQFPPPGEHGQFLPPGEQFPPPGEHGQFPPPGDQGQFSHPPTGQYAPPPGEPAEQYGSAPGGAGDPNSFAPASYGEVRQEIGADGMVRRVFDEDQPPAPPPGPEQSGGGSEQYSWAPPPLPPQQPPRPPQPSYQQPPQQQSHDNWQGGPPQQLPSGFQQHPAQPGPPGQSIGDLNLLKRQRRAPRSGWRKAVHKVTGGAINPGEAPADVVQRELVDRVNEPVRGDYRIAILSLKGGVGKTTTTVGLGSTFASSRGDRVIAIDANPDLGTLAHRVPRQTRSTVRNLLEDQHISRYSDVRAHTSQAPSRLEVLASEQDPAVSEAFSEADYRRAIGILQQFYNIILTDCGTGLMHSAMKGVLDLASSLILVTSPAIDGARSASATLDWLEHHGYGKLVERTVVVVNASRRGASTVDLDQLRKLFLDRTRAVQVVPFDDHLAEGAEIDLELVGKPTRTALLELAAMVADDFGYHVPQPPFPGPHTQYSGPQQGGYPSSQGPQGQYPGSYPGQDPYPSHDRYPGPQGY
uniref:nucleotide-binding protein n=1 Tax=Nocardia mexicana TaxID=279262 RepID=UPI001FE900CD|nr:AAA family ATPase [Nocardia mexicana]